MKEIISLGDDNNDVEEVYADYDNDNIDPSITMTILRTSIT